MTRRMFSGEVGEKISEGGGYDLARLMDSRSRIGRVVLCCAAGCWDGGLRTCYEVTWLNLAIAQQSVYGPKTPCC